ncbi:chondroitin proteoglycan 2-like isoform X2 [Pungitius pungitius]|uniref:chondroitin proteoglycan 2-like isoform X2 n=1 Tax=Pungitius pungitius TaxID=134920 RepID=UPI002E12B301
MCKLTLTAALCLIIACLGLSGIEAQGGRRNRCTGKPDGQYPNPGNQRSFIYCVAGTVHVRKCPANLVYNSAIKVCAYPDSPVNNANECYGRKDGQYTNPKDQHSFLSCVAGLTYVMQCPANLVYVEAKNWCDYPNQHHY